MGGRGRRASGSIAKRPAGWIGAVKGGSRGPANQPPGAEEGLSLVEAGDGGLAEVLGAPENELLADKTRQGAVAPLPPAVGGAKSACRFKAQLLESGQEVVFTASK